MSRYLLTISNERDRAKAAEWLARLPFGWRVQFLETKRTLPQNDRMWAMLTDISTQLVWHGQRYSPDDWKDHFMHVLNGGRWMPAEDGGMIPIGRSTSKLGKQEHTLLQDIIEGFAERHGVILHGPKESEAAETEGVASEKPAADPSSVREPASPAKPGHVSAGDAHKMTEAEADEYAAQWAEYYATLPAGEPEDAFCAETQHVASVFLKQEFHRAYRLMQAAVFAEKKDAA